MKWFARTSVGFVVAASWAASACGSGQGLTPDDAASAADVSDASSESNQEGAPFCIGGCLCLATPETCPSDCLRTHRADGSFVCGYACDAPGVPCNCVYQPDDGGIYVCDSFTIRACPSTNQFTGQATGS